MNFDANKLAELKEAHRSNVAKEAIEAAKGEAAMKTAQAKMGDSLVKAATGMAGILGRNDPVWEVPSDVNLKKTGRMSFVTFRRGLDTQVSVAKVRKASLFVLNFQATLGFSEEGLASTAWIAFKHIYDMIRGKNRGATNYTVNDLVGYFFPPLTIAGAIANIERLLKTCRQYSIHENSVGRAMIFAQGFDYDDVSANLPTIEDKLSLLKAKLNLIPLPKDFHVLKRWIYLNSFIFADSDDQVRQFFIPRLKAIHTPTTSDPHYVTTLKELATTTGTDSDNYMASDIIDDIQAMYNVLIDLLANTTYQAISGDIYNYYNTEVVNFSLEVDYSEDVIIYDQEFLLQYANSDWLFSEPSFLVNQWGLKLSADGFIGQGVYNSLGQLSGLFGYNDLEADQAEFDDHLIRPIFKGELDESEVFIATAMTFTNDVKQDGVSYYYYDENTLTAASVQGTWFHLKSYRTEVFLKPQCYIVDKFGTPVTTGDNFYASHGIVNSGIFSMAVISDLDIWPKLVTRSGPVTAWINELDVYGLLPSKALDNIHASSLTALWNVPTTSGRGRTFSDGPNSSHRGHGGGPKGGGKDRGERGDPKPNENH